MYKLKTVTLLVSVLAFMLFFTGCAENGEKAENNHPDQLTVGLVLSVGGQGDKGFNDAACNGLVKAQKDFGESIDTTLAEPPNINEFEAELRTLAKKNTNLIIALGYYFPEPLAKVARDYPGTKFVLIDATLPDLKPDSNITCITFKDNEGAFLAGAAAALKSRTGKIGFVGGADIPVINNFETGYIAGARYINPKVAVLSNYIAAGSEGFYHPNTARTYTLGQISNGADVIFQAAGDSGKGVIEAAASQKKLAIGVDVDQTFTAPESQRAYILTSIKKGVDSAVVNVIKRQLDKKLDGGYIELGIKDGVETYAENDINKEMLADIKPQLDEIKDKIANQEIAVPSNQ